MPNASGFTLTEVLISLLLLCLTGLGALSVSLLARQQIIMATQQTVALSLAAELAGRMVSHDSEAGQYEGVHPLWTAQAPTECTAGYFCNSEQLSHYHLYSTLTASGQSQSLQLLQQPAVCIQQQADQRLVQLSWKALAKIQIQRPASVCDVSPHRSQLSVVVP